MADKVNLWWAAFNKVKAATGCDGYELFTLLRTGLSFLDSANEQSQGFDSVVRRLDVADETFGTR